MSTTTNQSRIDNAVLREEIRILTDEILRLREENRQLRQLTVPRDWEVPVELGLTPKEKIILAALYKAEGVMLKHQLMSILYHYHAADEVPAIKIVDVFICKLRKKLAQFDLVINTAWASGYSLDPASRERLKNWHISAKINDNSDFPNTAMSG